MSKERLREFIATVEGGRKPDRADLDFIANALKEILDGGNTKADLGLNKKRGRQQPWSWQLDQRTAIAIAVMARMKPYGNLSRDDAFEEVARQLEDGAKDYGKKSRTVRRFYDDHREFAMEYIKYYDNNPTLAFANLLGFDLVLVGPTKQF